MNLAPLMEALGYTFNDAALLEAALTHRSFAHENGATVYLDNERLEFLGDALLNFITGQMLFHGYPEHGEGDLTVMRAALVQTRTLASFSRRFNLQQYIRISRGEERSGARKRVNLLADTFEALIAAIAIDGGWESARDFVEPLLREELKRIDAGHATTVDYKTALQHKVQAAIGVTPTYRQVAVSGPDHNRVWTIEVWVGELRLGSGTGSSKQLASQSAAQAAIELLDGPNPPELPLDGDP